MANKIALNAGFMVNVEAGTATVPATFTADNPFIAGATVDVPQPIVLPLVLPFTKDDVLAAVRAAFPQATEVSFR